MAGRLEAPHAWQSASRHWGDWADSSQASQAGNSARLTDRSEPACRPHVPAPCRSGATQRRLRGRSATRSRTISRAAYASSRERKPSGAVFKTPNWKPEQASDKTEATAGRLSTSKTIGCVSTSTVRRHPAVHDAGHCEARRVARGKLRSKKNVQKQNNRCDGSS